MSHLQGRGIKTIPTERGPDHGVWVPLKAAFRGPREELDGLPETLPLCQVSLPASNSASASLRLGRALRDLRSRGIAIVGGGQAVHNLRDHFSRYSRQVGGKRTFDNKTIVEPFEYTLSFAQALSDAVVPPRSGLAQEGGDSTEVRGMDEERWQAAKALFEREDYTKAHPTNEHLLPALVSLGAALPDEKGEELFRADEGALSW
ncbi:hypothetical protein IE53DRAFT_104415 [Violaceomyces palustris]|uniref:Uncharacterized protein n=1 Tax=Violaceomyces palustris TaxID=1673888 RepID=A0ACD0P772_9BASI|nr:hypothetical protein IE53DRAFT_104415 [Violaceomyces palustris]